MSDTFTGFTPNEAYNLYYSMTLGGNPLPPLSSDSAFKGVKVGGKDLQGDQPQSEVTSWSTAPATRSSTRPRSRGAPTSSSTTSADLSCTIRVGGRLERPPTGLRDQPVRGRMAGCPTV